MLCNLIASFIDLLSWNNALSIAFGRQGATFGGLPGNTSPRKDGGRNLEHHVKSYSCDNGVECGVDKGGVFEC